MPEIGTSQTHRLVSVAFNPLKWIEGDRLMASLSGIAPSSDNLLRFLNGPFSTASFEDYRTRYDELASLDNSLLAIPNHPRLLNGVLRPVHNAKAAYILGHFVSCVASCGLVAEMLAIFRFDLADVRCAAGSLDRAKQELLWSGKTFEHSGQSQRVGVLRALGLIDDATEKSFREILGIRRQHLHLLVDENANAQTDAREAYKRMMSLCRAILGQQIVDGSFAINYHPDVVRWINQNVTANSSPQS